MPLAAGALFVLGALAWSRLGLHRTLATMPAIPGETLVREVSGVTVSMRTGGPERSGYIGSIVRITDQRAIIAQRGLGGGDVVRAVLLWGDGEQGMRAADAEAFARAGSFSIVKVRQPEVSLSEDGTLLVPVDPIWPPSVGGLGTPRWDFPGEAGAVLQAAIRPAK